MMKCSVFRSCHDLSQRFSLRFRCFLRSYPNFQQQAQNVLILTRDTLASNWSQRAAVTGSRRWWCWWVLLAIYNRPQQHPSPRCFISKIGRKINRKKWCVKALIDTRSAICVERLNVFMRFPVKTYCASIFLFYRHAVDMFNEFLFSLGNFGKICLPHPYTTALLIFLAHWQLFLNFARRGHIR